MCECAQLRPPHLAGDALRQLRRAGLVGVLAGTILGGNIDDVQKPWGRWNTSKRTGLSDDRVGVMLRVEADLQGAPNLVAVHLPLLAHGALLQPVELFGVCFLSSVCNAFAMFERFLGEQTCFEASCNMYNLPSLWSMRTI